VGWAVTVYIVEPRLRTKTPEEGGPGTPAGEQMLSLDLTDSERRGLLWALGALLVTLGIFFLSYFAPWGFLHDPEGSIGNQPGQQRFPTWTRNLVPLLLVLFLVPGIAFGVAVKTIRS